MSQKKIKLTTMADIIIILILSGITFLIIRSLIRQRTKGGCGSCGSNCGCSDCPQNKNKQK